MKMENTRNEYLKKWGRSANHFFENNDYEWMSNNIKKYTTVLEIGCGSGEGTLTLLKKGHKVIAIEKNQFCIENTKKLLSDNGYSIGAIDSDILSCDAIILNIDLFQENLLDCIEKFNFDLVICWNVGGLCKEDNYETYMQVMLKQGITLNEIINKSQTLYAQAVQVLAFEIAKARNVAINFIDRSPHIVNEWEEYYSYYKEKYSFSKIRYNNRKTTTLSEGGLVLNINGEACKDELIDIYLVSVLVE